MDKKFYLLLFFLVNSLIGNSQELTPKMCQVYYGKVKSITVLEPQPLKGNKTEFYEDSKVKSIIQQGNIINFDWQDDGEVKCELFNNGNCIETAYLYVNELSETFYDYEAGNTFYNIWFNDNGTFSHSKITSNGNTIECQYYYKSEAEIIPYKIINRMGTQSQTIYVKVLKFDSKGNAVEFTQTSNGQTIKFKRVIEYY